jgi:hypothetical protein
MCLGYTAVPLSPIGYCMYVPYLMFRLAAAEFRVSPRDVSDTQLRPSQMRRYGVVRRR